jgi:hypothetical protein
MSSCSNGGLRRTAADGRRKRSRSFGRELRSLRTIDGEKHTLNVQSGMRADGNNMSLSICPRSTRSNAREAVLYSRSSMLEKLKRLWNEAATVPTRLDRVSQKGPSGPLLMPRAIATR